MRKALLALAFAVVAAPSMAASWERLEGQRSGIREFHVEAVRDAAAWKGLWERHAPGQPLPEVSFDKEQVAAVFLGQTPTAGVSIELTLANDPLDASRLVVYYSASGRRAPSFAAAVISYPFVIIKTRRAPAVAFESNARVALPEVRPPSNPLDARRVGALLETLAVPSFDGL